MPPIYNFSVPDRLEESKWGWHRATELVEAINNILGSHGRNSMTPEEITDAFPSVRLNRRNLRRQRKSFYSPVVREGRIIIRMGLDEFHWLATLVNMDFYLPAKLGMNLINAVKSQIRKS